MSKHMKYQEDGKKFIYWSSFEAIPVFDKDIFIYYSVVESSFPQPPEHGLFLPLLSSSSLNNLTNKNNFYYFHCLLEFNDTQIQ